MAADPVEAAHEAYLAWLATARPLLEAKAWGAALRLDEPPYPYYKLRLDPVPLVPLDRPLAQARIVLIASGGVYREDMVPFDAASPVGDSTYRIIPVETEKKRLRIAHEHYDHTMAEQDLNVVYPVGHLEALASEGIIGSIAPAVLSFSGFILDASAMLHTLAPDLLRQVKAIGADGALLVPV